MESRLSNRDKAFVELYLTCWNASEAYRKAGYRGNNADVMGPRLLGKDGIQAVIKARLAELTASADEVLERLTQHARGTVEPFLTPGGAIDLSTEEARANLALLKKVKVKTRRYGRSEDPIIEVETEIELHDPQAALVHIGRHYGLFEDKAGITDETKTFLKEFLGAVAATKQADRMG